MKEEMKRTQVVEIPEGTFEGNCSDCVYADWNDTDRYGRVYCRGSYGGYNNPSDRNGCFYYKRNGCSIQELLSPIIIDKSGLPTN